MPVEIRELVIKASVNEGGQGSAPPPTGANVAQDQAALVAVCVEQVLSILKEKVER